MSCCHPPSPLSSSHWGEGWKKSLGVVADDPTNKNEKKEKSQDLKKERNG